MTGDKQQKFLHQCYRQKCGIEVEAQQDTTHLKDVNMMIAGVACEQDFDVVFDGTFDDCYVQSIVNTPS